MIIKWTFNDMRLEAKNEVGQLMAFWKVEAAYGRVLAMLLNQNQTLGRLALQLPEEANDGP